MPVDEFPLYRRTANGSNLYRIEAPDRFTEVQRIGARAVVHQVVARAYPEMVRIQEMIEASPGGPYAELGGDVFNAAWEEASRPGATTC